MYMDSERKSAPKCHDPTILKVSVVHICQMLYSCVFLLNSFTHHDVVHETMSRTTIMTGQRFRYNKHCRVEFGTYVQIHEKHIKSMQPRTSGAIALRPSGNGKGRHYFLSLHSGKKYAQKLGDKTSFALLCI
jgi:hypothetical protein